MTVSFIAASPTTMQTTGSTSVSQTIPNETGVGDLILVSLFHSLDNLVAPEGFTEVSIESWLNNGNTTFISVYQHFSDGTDAGEEITFTQAQSAVMCMVIAVFAGGAGLGVGQIVTDQFSILDLPETLVERPGFIYATRGWNEASGLGISTPVIVTGQYVLITPESVARNRLGVVVSDEYRNIGQTSVGTLVQDTFYGSNNTAGTISLVVSDDPVVVPPPAIGTKESVWPFQPQANFTETMEWKTEVLISEQGQQRINLRANPRTTIEYNYQLPKTVHFTAWKQYLESPELLLPIWHELDEVALVANSDTSVTLTTSENRPYVVGGYALVMSSLTNYEIVRITSIAGNIINFDPITGNFPRCVVMPCVPAHTVSDFGFTLAASPDYTLAKTSFTFALPYLEEVNGWTPFEGTPVSPWRSEMNGATGMLIKNRRFFDSVNGPMTPINSLPYSDTGAQVALSFNTKQEIRDFKALMNFQKGKFKRFWISSWTADFVPTEDITNGDEVIRVSKDLYNKRDIVTQPIVISKRDGTLIPLRLIGVEPYSSTEEELALAAPINVSVSLSEIEMISVLKLNTLNTDSVGLTYKPGSASCSFPIITVLE